MRYFWIGFCIIVMGCGANMYRSETYPHGEGDPTRCIGAISVTEDMWSCVMLKGDE